MPSLALQAAELGTVSSSMEDQNGVMQLDPQCMRVKFVVSTVLLYIVLKHSVISFFNINCYYRAQITL